MAKPRPKIVRIKKATKQDPILQELSVLSAVIEGGFTRLCNVLERLQGPQQPQAEEPEPPSEAA